MMKQQNFLKFINVFAEHSIDNKSFVAFVMSALVSILLVACTEGSLTRLPEDQISNEQYWKSANDMELYVNQFYTTFPSYPGFGGGIFWEDNNSDNMVPAGSVSGYNERLAGLNTVNSGIGWPYDNIRDVNFMLDNVEDNGSLDNASKRYIGEARFFRAYFYFHLLKAYGAIPWVGQVLTTESKELYAPRTPRNEVMDSIIKDLDYAIANLLPKNQTGENRLNRECALLFKSRVALFEGTWEKYHQGTVFGVEGRNGEKFLKAAANAARQLIDMNTAAIYSTGDPDHDYLNLFNQDDLSNNPEILLWKKYDRSLNMSHNLQRYQHWRGGATGVTKSLVNTYLVNDGKPIAMSSRYKGDATLADVIANRDPRLHQILWVPGDTMEIADDGSIIYFEKPAIDLTGSDLNTTGYQLKKGASTSPRGQHQTYESITAAIIFRYAEALLNYAEAKAELGDITQNDLDISINKLRDRVGMPHLILGNISFDPNWKYSDLSPVINEIRRERRVELACEGYRLDDILRWAAADELITSIRPLGAKFNSTTYPNLTIGEDILVNENGYIDPYQEVLPSGWGFRLDRDYLLPIPPNEITLNDKLNQNPGWE